MMSGMPDRVKGGKALLKSKEITITYRVNSEEVGYSIEKSY